MLEPSTDSTFDFTIVCHAEVDLPAWLRELTGESSWRLRSEEESDMCDIYTFERGEHEAQVVLYHTGHATVEVNGNVVYDKHLTSTQGCARLQYYNADSGEPVLLN